MRCKSWWPNSRASCLLAVVMYEEPPKPAPMRTDDDDSDVDSTLASGDDEDRRSCDEETPVRSLRPCSAHRQKLSGLSKTVTKSKGTVNKGLNEDGGKQLR